MVSILLDPSQVEPKEEEAGDVQCSSPIRPLGMLWTRSGPRYPSTNQIMNNGSAEHPEHAFQLDAGE